MSTKLVTFYSCIGPVCGDKVELPVDVVLCISYEKVAPLDCPESEEESVYTFRTIEGSLVSQELVCCGLSSQWKYVVSYDSAQVIPGYSLVGGDISSVACKGCVGQYAQDRAGDEVYVSVDEETLVKSLHSQHGCVYELGANSQVLYRSTELLELSNTVTETDLLTYTVEADLLGTFRKIHGVLNFSYIKNTTGLGRTVTLKFYYGTTVLVTEVVNIADATAGNVTDIGRVEFDLTPQNSVGDQILTEFGFFPSGVFNGAGVATEDSTDDLALRVTATFSAASSDLELSVVNAFLEIL